jgi:hypothetical protein
MRALYLEELCERAFDLGLDEAEVFVDLVLEDFAQEGDVVVLGGELGDAGHDALGPLDDQTLQAEASAQERVQVLLQRLQWQSRGLALLVVFLFRADQVFQKRFQMIQSQKFRGWCVVMVLRSLH